MDGRLFVLHLRNTKNRKISSRATTEIIPTQKLTFFSPPPPFFLVLGYNFNNMASLTAVETPQVLSLQPDSAQGRDVQTQLNFFKDNEDGSPPAPTYVDKPESYERPSDTRDVTIHDVRGREDEFSIYKQGFQIYSHVSQEKDFLDDEKIKEVYYPETEQLLKDA